MEKMWNVYLIHHSHTDIGYTEYYGYFYTTCPE